MTQLKIPRRANFSRSMKNVNTFRTLKKAFFETFKKIKQRPFYLALPMLMDLLHLVVLSGVLGWAQLKAMEHIQGLQGLLDSSSAIVGDALNETTMALMLGQQSELMTLQSALIKLAYLILLSACILWMLFQGQSWRFAANMTSKKINYFKFFGRFTTLSAVWLILASIISATLFKTLFSMQVEFHQVKVGLETLTSVVFYALVAYFMFISYALVPKYSIKTIFQKTFKLGTKHFLPLLTMFFMLAVGFFIIDLILKAVGTANITAMMIVGFILLLPYLTWIRLYVILVVEKLRKI